MSIARVKQARSRAFTLLEITLAVAILATMAVAIYRFVEANLTSLRVSSETTTADARYGGLRDLLTAQWQSLSGTNAVLTGEPFKFSGRPRDEIRWTCSSGPGLLTRYAPGDFTVEMRLQPASSKSNRLDLGFLRKPNDDTGASSADQTWVPLIQNVASMEIRYFDPRFNGWVERWSEAGRFPRLVKIVIGRTDATVPWEMIIPLGRTPY
ncbi:MAG TPA: prepilin-type N-terminal cleavage/methylation domain-containing protein [Chthoniobacterales bacterium]|nr:prepilin-type N-terminal cleavage/methylation domain-containing protein [Chthoniobacterales bacterium]